MQITEQLLWLYIDGECTEEQQHAVDQALEQDEALQDQLRKLLHFHHQCQAFFRRHPSRPGPISPHPSSLYEGNRSNMVDTATLLANDGTSGLLDVHSPVRLNLDALGVVVLLYLCYVVFNGLAI